MKILLLPPAVLNCSDTVLVEDYELRMQDGLNILSVAPDLSEGELSSIIAFSLEGPLG